MEGVLIVGGIVVFSFGWMLWHAKRGARNDKISGNSLKQTNFPGSGGSGP